MLAFILFLFALACFINIVEAQLEARYGDKHHSASVIMNFTVWIGIAAMLPDTLPKHILLWIAARSWFDLLYNYFKGNDWHYLGANFTDLILKQMNPVFVLLIRFMTTVACIGYSA